MDATPQPATGPAPPSDEHHQAIELHRRLTDIDPATAPVLSTDRCLPRKEQAKLARQLFKRYRLRVKSVRTPRHSMAQSVDITVPKTDYERHDHNARPHAYPPPPDACPLCEQGRDTRERLEKLLDAAFPAHVDKSDTMTDYFNYCWMIH